MVSIVEIPLFILSSFHFMQSQLYVAFWQVMLQIPFELLHLSYLDNTFSATPNVPPGMANIYIRWQPDTAPS